MIKKILLTGAGGRLASQLRAPLSNLCDQLLSTDLKEDIGDLFKNEKFVRSDLSNYNEICDLVQGSTIICHFGAIVDEVPFEQLLGPNIIGSYNIWESAKNYNVKRVIYASSIHAVGMYSKTETLLPSKAHNPDSFYGLSKCFSEDLAKMYFEKNGIESVCLRIASCIPFPTSARSLSTWLSYEDLILLVTRCIDTPYIGFSVIYGVSNNNRKNINNIESSHIGFYPKDNAEDFSKKILQDNLSDELSDKGNQLHGGPFASTELGVSPMEKMKMIDGFKNQK